MIWRDKTRGPLPWHRARALGVGLVALSLCAGEGASAQTKEELDKARTLFKEGVALSAANNCAAALTRFRAVANVKMTAQVAFNIAECEERLGKLVSALGNYRVAAAQAEGDPKAKDVSTRVWTRIEAVEARVPKLTVKRGEGAETARIEFDGDELGASKLSAQFPVDPGAHVIVAKVGDKEYLRETVSLEEKELKTFEVKLDLSPKIDKPEEPTDKPVKPLPDQGSSKVPAGVALGVGGVGVVLGAVFMVLRGGTLSQLKDKCGNDTSCPPSAEPIADKGKLYTGLAEASFVVGAAGVVTGIVLLVTSGPSAAPKHTPYSSALRGPGVAGPVELHPYAPGASIGGLSLVGRF